MRRLLDQGRLLDPVAGQLLELVEFVLRLALGLFDELHLVPDAGDVRSDASKLSGQLLRLSLSLRSVCGLLVEPLSKRPQLVLAELLSRPRRRGLGSQLVVLVSKLPLSLARLGCIGGLASLQLLLERRPLRLQVLQPLADRDDGLFVIACFELQQLQSVLVDRALQPLELRFGLSNGLMYCSKRGRTTTTSSHSADQELAHRLQMFSRVQHGLVFVDQFAQVLWRQPLGC